MKKGLLFLFSLILLLLPGCKAAGGDTMDQALAFRAKLQGAEGCSFRSEITADYRDEVFTFTLSCIADQAGGISFQVEAPESIAGISGKVDGETGKVTFDGTALAFGPLADGQLSPLATPYVLVRSWRTGYITACGLDGEELRMTVDASFEEKANRCGILETGEGVELCWGVSEYGQHLAGRRNQNARLRGGMLQRSASAHRRPFGF